MSLICKSFMFDYWSFCNHRNRKSRLKRTKLKKHTFYEQFACFNVKELVVKL